jgi:hypothetical protein
MKGLIYKIEGYGLVYYGSTIQNINDRKYTHKSSYNNRDKRPELYCSSWIILEKGDDWIIEKIEELEFEDLDELRLREAYYQKNNNCVNITKLKTKDELREYKKDWAEKDRRNKGCKLKAEMVITKDPYYNARKKREARAKETPEQKEIRLQKRREQYKEKNINEKQKEYLANPEIKEKRRLQQIERRNKARV